jgi:HAD superfamily hydrolase (TIGR01509 family)
VTTDEAAMAMDAFDLVIFDCDGVLVDSELIANRVFSEMLGEIGLHFSLDETFERFMGRSMATCLDMVAKLRGSSVPTTFAEEYRVRTARAFQGQLVAIQGAREAVLALPIPYCVASSGDHEKMRMTLGATELLDLFDGKLFSVTEVARGKPFADIYTYAAKRIGVDPQRCAVVEDSPVGVEAGVAAGMTVFGYSKLTSAERLTASGAAVVFDDMRALPCLLFPNLEVIG